MNIIPAIDLKKGKVVRAIEGYRASYEPIDLVTSYSSNPIIIPDISSKKLVFGGSMSGK